MGKDTIVSVGGSSFIHLPVSPSAVGAVLELDIGSYIKVPHVIAQRVEVRINSTMVKTWTGTTGAVRSMSVPLPTDSVRSGELNINLRYHDAVCPSCIGTGADSRMRAIDLHAIRLSQAE
jgi:hypothetical protein